MSGDAYPTHPDEKGWTGIPGMWRTELEAWRNSLFARNLSPVTIGMYLYRNRTAARHVAPKLPYQVTTVDLLDWLGSNHQWGASAQSVSRAAIRSFYDWAVMTERADMDPSRRLPAVKVPAGRARPATEEAYATALAAAVASERVMLRLAGECGLRRAEVACIHRRDLDRHDDGWALLVHGKGRKERIVPLPHDIADELLALLDRSKNGHAFPSGSGHLHAQSIGQAVSALLPPGVTMHMLRHRFGTRVYQATHDLLATQTLLGHASPAMTRRYVADDPASLRAALSAAVPTVKEAA